MGFTDDELMKCVPELKRYAYSLGRDADDLVQATLERAIRKRHMYSPGELQGWLKTLMRHIRFTEVRTRTRRPIEGIGLEAKNIPDYTQQPEINAYIRDIERSIMKLPSKYRSVLNYMILNDEPKPERPYHKCAKALGIKAGTVRSRLHRAREYLRNSGHGP